MLGADSQRSRAPPSRLENFVNQMPVPMAVSLCFAFVAMLGIFFGRGDQIYPVFNDAPPEVDCPECRLFNDTYAKVTERQFRFFFEVAAPLAITRRTAWKLLRLKVYGPSFSQELRNADECGIYTFGPRHQTLHFELAQEGPARLEMYCLDVLLINTTAVVAPWARDTPYSILHRNGDFTNVCLSAGNLALFVRGWVWNYSHNILGNVTFINRQIGDYAKDVGLNDVVFMFQFTALDLQEMSSIDLFKRVILVTFVQSQLSEAVFFRDPIEGFPTALSIIKRVANGRLATQVNLCAKKVTTNPDFNSPLSIAALTQMRMLATEKYQNRTDTIVVNHAPLFEPLLTQPGLTFVDISNYTDLKSAVKIISTARAMVSLDDADRVINAFWLPADAPLLLVIPPLRTLYSPAVAQLLSANRTILAIPGDLEGAVSTHPELFAMCTSGSLDPNAPECAPAYANLSFTFTAEKIVEALR
jgi:hypothetical protein